jgi:phosphoglycerate dehydrogenase-like enzyme
MKKVLFFNGNDKRVEDILRNMMPEGFEVTCKSSKLTNNEKIELIRDAEFLVLHPAVIDGAVLQEAGALRLIQLLTAGYDKMDLKLCGEMGVPVATNGGANSWSVAEHSIALLLALYKRLFACDQSVRAGTWRKPKIV